jgi:propanol-preferring alcohol dehydrogenase
VGLRALRLCGLQDGEPLGLTGFGASGHLVLRFARHLYPSSEVHVFARDADQRAFALELGASWAGGTDEAPPTPLQAIIDTTPAWRPVVRALAALRPGGRLVVNAIRKEDADRAALEDLDYPEHLWLEKELKSVANVTRRDARDALRIAAEIGLRPRAEVVPLERANEALARIRAGGFRGATVLAVGAGD